MLLLIPVTALVLEIKNMDIISSTVRSAGVWVLFTIALPIGVAFSMIRANMLTHDDYMDR